MLRLQEMTTQTVEANMKMYARIVAETLYADTDVDALIRYAMEYQSRMGW